MWIDTRKDAVSYVSKETHINESVFLIRKADFERWGDKNLIKDVSKAWFSDDTLALDVKVEQLSEDTGMNITEDDVIEFIKANKPGCYKSPFEVLLDAIEIRFKEVAGFKLQDYYAEHLIKSCQLLEENLKPNYPF